MKEKFIVEIYDNNNTLVKTSKEKTLKSIASNLKLDYHDARTLYYIHSGKQTKKFLHPNLSLLSKKIKIKDNNDLYDNSQWIL